jgi:hypothetical protein
MPRAVMPWTWGRKLRDEGPRGQGSRDFIAAMHTLRTFTDDSGFAFPSLRVWADGARMAVNTLRKQIDLAVKLGWLSVQQRAGSGRAWKKPIYRCAIPDGIELSDKDEMLTDALISVHGDIDEAVSPMADTPSRQRVSPLSDTPSPASQTPPRSPIAEGVSNGGAKVCQPAPERVSKNREGVSNSPEGVSPRVIPKSYSEVLEVSKTEVLKTEGAARAQPDGVGNGGNGKSVREPKPAPPAMADLPKADREQLAVEMMARVPDQPLSFVAREHGLSLEDMQRLKQKAEASDLVRQRTTSAAKKPRRERRSVH